MDIKSSFSSFAKNIGNGATQVAKKSGELVEISKINSSINSNEDKIYELYSQIGEKVFEKFRKTDVVDYDLKSICKEITEILEENEKLIFKINKLNKIKRCTRCGQEMKLEILFCPKCGLEQELTD